MAWKKPRRLVPGDRIRVVAPASPFNRQDFDQGIMALRNMGYSPVYDPSIFARHLYLAGTDQERASLLIEALKEEGTRAVFCARGGYGSGRLLPYLRAQTWDQPKLLMGCSDITALLDFFTSDQGWVTFHGPMVAGDFARARVPKSTTAALLAGRDFPMEFKGKLEVWRAGRASGILFGGCLSILCTLLGTPCRWQMEAAPDLILFLEDIRCKPYQIDRMLTQLVQSGVMARVRGLILGEMVECGGEGPDLRTVVLDALADFNFPIAAGFPSGHTTAESLTLPLGVPAELDTDRGSLVLPESPVAE